MSNEEKILEMLQTMQADMKGITVRLDKMEDRFDKLEDRFGKLEDRFDKLETKVDRQKEELQAEIKNSEGRMIAMQEAHFDPKFALLADGHALIVEQMPRKEDLDKAQEKVEVRLDVLEAVVRLHTHEIKELKEKL